MASFPNEDASEDEEEDWSAPLDDPNIQTPCFQKQDEAPGQKNEVAPAEKPVFDTKPNANNKDELVSRMELNDHKAGMEGLDRERINKIIYEASKGSRFYENEMKKERQVTARIEEQKKKLSQLTPEQIQIGVNETDVTLQALEESRDLSRTIVHIDMDAFYAAVEMRDNPALRHVPMAVGSNSMLSTSNYIARRFGVRAAMPGFIGRKLCPDLVIVPTHFDKYNAISRQIRAVMADYDPNFCPMSLDEAYLDFTEHLIKRNDFGKEQMTFQVMLTPEEICSCDQKNKDSNEIGNSDKDIGVDPGSLEDKSTEESQGTDNKNVCTICGRPLDISQGKVETFGVSGEEAVREMRARIHWETKLTASAGIAPNTMLAKVCSDKNKPNGQYYLTPTKNSVSDFIKDLDIRKVSGIGKVSARMLNSIGVKTCSNLYRLRGVLYHLSSEVSLNYFLRISLGIGSTRVERDGERKSMSTERTFSEINEPRDLYEKCHELSISLAEDMNDEELVGKTVGIKLKTVKFKLMTRAQTLLNYTSDAEQIYGAARELLRTEIMQCQPEPLRLRLMGVRMSNLMPKNAVSDQKQCTITSLLSKMKSKPPCTDSPSEGDPPVSCTVNEIVETSMVPKLNENTDQSEEKAQKEKPTLNSVWLRSGRLANKTKTYQCPICSEDVEAPNLEQFNRHIDECLSGDTICKAARPDRNPERYHPGRSVEDTNDSQEAVEILTKINPNKITELISEGPIKNDTQCHMQTEITHETNNIDQETVKETDLQCVDNANEEAVVVNKSICKSHLQASTAGACGDTNQPTKLNGAHTFGEELQSTSSRQNELFTQLTQQSDNFICPVCNRQQDDLDLNGFNRHVDECLNHGLLTEDVNLPNPRSAKMLLVEKHTNRDSSKKTKSDSRKKSVPKKSSTVQKQCMEKSQTTKGMLSHGGHEEVGDSSIIDGIGNDSIGIESNTDLCLTCPVCDLGQEWTSQDAFSRHVDACLNRAAIKEMLHNDPDQQNKRLPSPPPEEPASKRKKTLAKGIQRIDSFFKH